jgi:hypothetical protein
MQYRGMSGKVAMRYSYSRHKTAGPRSGPLPQPGLDGASPGRHDSCLIFLQRDDVGAVLVISL